MKKVDATKVVVRGTEWFSSLALLNLCWLLFSLPIFTIIPATDTVFEIVNHWETEGRSKGVLGQFKETFKQNFSKSFKWGLPILVVLLIIGVDIYILNRLSIATTWFQIGKYAFYTICFLILLAFLFAYPLSKRLGEKHVRVIFMGFLAAIGNPLVTVGVILSMIALLIIYTIWPSMLFFFSLSGLAWIMTKATSHILDTIEEKQQLNK